LKRETDIAENSIRELQTLPKQIQNEIDAGGMKNPIC
jgi:hypothetical protein